MSLFHRNFFSTAKSLVFSKTANDALIVLGGSGIGSLLGFIFVFVIARRLGPAQFGIYSTIINYVTFLAAVIDIGINQSLVSFIGRSKSKKEKKTWISTSFGAVLATTSVLGLAASLFYQFFLRNLWHHPSGLFSIVFLTIIAITVNIFFLNLFQALRKFWQRSILDVAFSVIRLLIVGILLVYASINLKTSFQSILFAYILAIVYAFYVAKRFLSLGLFSKEKLGNIYRFSRWLAGTGFFANLYGRLDVMMLAWLSSAYITGIYSAAARFILIFPLVVSSLSSVVSPRFAGFTTLDELDKYFRKTIGIALGLSLVMSILILIAEPLILIAYTEDFVQAVPVFRLLVSANVPLILSIPASNALVYFFKKPQYA